MHIIKTLILSLTHRHYLVYHFEHLCLYFVEDMSSHISASLVAGVWHPMHTIPHNRTGILDSYTRLHRWADHLRE